jgi:hypothetical protein
MAKQKKQSKVQRRPTAKRGKARKVVKSAAAKRAKPKRAPVKKAARPVAPVVETVAAEVIEQPAPGVITVTGFEETPEVRQAN